MENLPLEVALDILSRLPIISLIRARFVCRFWHSLAKHPILPPLHFSRVTEADLCLLLHSHLPLQHHLYSLHFSYSNHNTINNIQTLARLSIPTSIPQFTISGSCNGLLCLQDSLSQDQYVIYNPFTRDSLHLPNPKHFVSQRRVTSGFGFLSSEKYYKVVRITYYRSDEANTQIRRPLPESEVEVLTVGDCPLAWRNIGKTSYQVQGQPSNVLVNEKLHWLTLKYRNNWATNIISFDLADEQFRQVPSHQSGIFGRHCTHLVNLRGCLSAVVQGFRCLYIWVMKEYGDKDSWVKEFTLSIDPRLNPYANQLIDGSSCFPLNLSQVRVLCILGDGEILLQHRCRNLVVFSPNSGIFRELEVLGLPEDFNALVHIGSLNWLDR